MKKTYSILLAGFAALAVFSCNKDVKPAAPMSCEEVQKKLSDVAVATIKEVDPDNYKEWGQSAIKLYTDYKTIGAACAMANGHKVGAESAVDINLAKQLNVLMTQLGVAPTSIVMNLGSAAAGYGFEYVASTMDRVKAAALEQNDTMLQMPVITPVSLETWSVKESIMSQADMPEWGDKEERAVDMEVVTASACLTSGSDAVILRHPTSVKTIAAMLAALA